MTWNPPPGDGVIPPPQPKPAPNVGPEATAPTPAEVAAEVAARQAKIDAARAAGQVPVDPNADPAKAQRVIDEAAAAAAERSAVPSDSTQRWSAPTSFPSDPAEAAARHAAAAAEGAGQQDPGVAVPPSSEPVQAAPRGYAEPPPPVRTPKYLLGAFLKIPGGFSGRVVAVFNGWDEMIADPDVQAAGGPERVLRGKQGTGVPTTKDQPFYRCRSNRFDYDLVVGELDGHLIQQGTGAPQL